MAALQATGLTILVELAGALVTTAAWIVGLASLTRGPAPSTARAVDVGGGAYSGSAMTSLFDSLSLSVPGVPSRPPRDASAVLPSGLAPRSDRRGTEAEAEERRARRQAKADALVDGLNPQQREAVLHHGGPLLIVAGAGSGKTRVLTHRIGYLLATRRARAGEVLAITFTNKAAAEMRERVEQLVGPAAGRMWVSTFHSACVRILRREAGTLGLRSSFSIYDAADSQRLLTLVARELDLDPKRYPAKALANKISNLKDELVDPETFARPTATARPTTSTRRSRRSTRATRRGSSRRTRSTSTT